MDTSSRRSFLKKAGLGAAGLTLGGLCRVEAIGAEEENPLATRPLTGKVVDAHLHADAKSIDRCLQVMDDNYIRYGINIGVTGDKAFHRFISAAKPHQNRLGTMYAFDWSLIKKDPDFFSKAPDMLARAVEAGAIGVKSFKDLGLKVRDKKGDLVRVDDPRLFPIWQRAGELGIIVAFHTTDPKAFFETWNPQNERWKELELHPGWSFADRSKYPPRDVLLEQRNNVIRKFPQIKFHCCHVANNSEDIKTVSKWMDEMPNLHVDIAARLGELGRHSAKDGRDFFTRHQDRILFGTDRMFYSGGDIQGAGPSKRFTKAEDQWFYRVHWRYLQTNDKQFAHPTPIQGDWKIDAVGLDKTVLEKVYWQNAYKLFRLDRFGVA
ncbi:MAG: amidohydrolase family protein [Pirellulales bacterium]|nr:amidohydrolase family protein [Pirellulales bacterium]